MKQAANEAKPGIKLIMQDELDAQIAARSKHRNQFGRKPSKQGGKKQESKEHVIVTAKDLHIPQGVFKQQDGTILGPLRGDQVGQQCQWSCTC